MNMLGPMQNLPPDRSVFSIQSHCRQLISIGLLLALGFTFAYWEVIKMLIHQWWSDDMYSYGFLIPGISIYLIWVRRHLLRSLRPVPNYVVGLTVLILSTVLLIIGHAGGILALQEISLISTIVGLVLILLGTSFLIRLWMPIAYLLFMIPIWEIITDRLHFPFQNLSAGIGITLLHMLGIPAYRQSIYIELPNITLEVAKVCSGLNYLIAVTAIGIPVAYLFLVEWTKRFILITCAIVVAILANSFRVALIGTLVYYGLSQDVHGPFHILQGIFVSLLGFGTIFMGTWILSRLPARGTSLHDPNIMPALQRELIHDQSSNIFRVALIVFGVFLFSGFFLQFYRPSPVPLERDLDNFPYQVENWKGLNAEAIFNVYSNLGVDHQLSRIYSNDALGVVQLYIGYFEYQRQGKELVNDQLFYELKQDAVTIQVVDLDNYGLVKMNQILFSDRNNTKLILYWFDLNGRMVASPTEMRVYTALDALFHRRNSGAIFMVSADIQNIQDLPETLGRCQSFLIDIWPLINQYIPRSVATLSKRAS